MSEPIDQLNFGEPQSQTSEASDPSDYSTDPSSESDQNSSQHDLSDASDVSEPGEEKEEKKEEEKKEEGEEKEDKKEGEEEKVVSFDLTGLLEGFFGKDSKSSELPKPELPKISPEPSIQDFVPIVNLLTSLFKNVSKPSSSSSPHLVVEHRVKFVQN